MISNIVLNPSIDKTCIVEDLEIDQSNLIIDQRMSIGGEGVDVSRIIKILQAEPLVLSFLGGLNGRYIKSSLDKAKIKSNFIWVNGDTKLNTLLIDSITGTKTLLKDEGVSIQEKDFIRFRQEMKNYVKDSSVVLIDGRLPKGLTYEFFDEVIDHAKRYNTKIIMSTDGEELRKAFAFQPYAIKIKKQNLRDLNLHTNDMKEILMGLYDMMIEHSIHYIAVDMGIEGAYLISKNKICQGLPNIKIEPVNLKSNYSAFLAALTVGIERKYELEKIIKLMVASSYATMINTEKDELCNKRDIDYLLKKIKVKEMMNNRNGWLR